MWIGAANHIYFSRISVGKTRSIPCVECHPALLASIRVVWKCLVVTFALSHCTSSLFTSVKAFQYQSNLCFVICNLYKITLKGVKAFEA